MVGDLCNNLCTLRDAGMIYTALKHAATMTMSSNFNAMTANGIVDELVVSGIESMQALLNNVIAVQVFDQSHNIWSQCNYNHAYLNGRTKR